MMNEAPKVWIEMTNGERARARLTELGEQYAVGHALWATKTDANGAEVHRFMRDVQPGDIVLHLTDTDAFTGVSSAAGRVRDVEVPRNTSWSGRECWTVPLTDYIRIDPPLKREQFFGEPYRTRLNDLLVSGEKNLFFNTGFNFNQSAYLTPCPPALLAILNDAYRDVDGRVLVVPSGSSKWLEEQGHTLLVAAWGASLDNLESWSRDVAAPALRTRGKLTFGWSIHVNDQKADALAAWPYLYMYVGAPAKQLFYRLHVVEHRTTKAADGIPCPWPEFAEESVDDPGAEEHWVNKTWFLVDRVERLEPAIPINALVQLDGKPAGGFGLLSAYGLWRLKDSSPPRQAWIFQANPNKYNLVEELRHVHVGNQADWYAPTNQKDMRVGDVALVWQSGLNAGIYATGEVNGPVFQRELSSWRAGEADGAEMEPAVPFRYTCILPQPVLRTTLLEHPVLQGMTILKRPAGTIFRVTDKEWAELEPLLSAGPVAPGIADVAAYTNTTVAELEELKELLESRRQVILEGPPGSGKTFIADAFGRFFSKNLLTGPRDGHMIVVQFHQSYGYEDFIQGIRPEVRTAVKGAENAPHDGAGGHLSYVLKDGIFKELCDAAAKQPDEPFVILIDEINRGNIARIFGELLLLLEYRQEQVRLPYATADQPLFSIPPNVYILGTMNTADRSLAQIDYALRRRFVFYELSPIVDGKAPYLKEWLSKQPFTTEVQQEILGLFIRLNQRVRTELGEDFLIGHSYFMTPDIATPHGRERIWKRAIMPLLEEYFYNRQNRAEVLGLFSLPTLMQKASPNPEGETIS